MRCFLVSSIVIASLLASAHADRKISPAALVELERGEQLFRAKDYAAAIAAFEAGYALDPQSIFLYDKAQAQRLSGDCAAAIETYKAFLATRPPEHEAIRARKNIANCEATLPPSPATPPAPPVPVVEPAPPAVVVSAALPAAPSSVAREERAWWHDRVGVTLATTGVIALGVGAGFAVAARTAAGDTAFASSVDEWSHHRAVWQRDRIIAGVAAGAGVALVTLAAIRFSVHDRTVQVAATGGDGAGLAVGGAW